jgi:hypothetical protein
LESVTLNHGDAPERNLIKANFRAGLDHLLMAVPSWWQLRRRSAKPIAEYEKTVIVGNVEPSEMTDIIEIEQLLARYAVGMTMDDIESVVEVFTPDGTYSAFGDTYQLHDFPTLVAAAPKGLFMTGTPQLDIDGDSGRGRQTLCFVDQTSQHMRIGWYTDTYRRTEGGWRLQTRSMTFLRRSGERDAGKPHDPSRPEPSASGG